MTNSTLAAVLHDLRRLAEPRDDRRQDDRQLLERFLVRREEDAFALLIRRHGRMVLSACRCVLSDEADVEDAFQATFLVLLRRASSMTWRTSIGAWLFGVAHRVAVRARTNVQRRQRHESEASRLRPELQPPLDLSWREAVGILHEELDRLPDRYRLPLLLCYFDGKTREEAATILACSAGAVKGRLERGREMLRTRLLRRGLTLSAALLTAASLAAQPASALPVGLMGSTIKAALAMAAGEGLAGVVSASVAELVKGMTAAMIVSKAKIAMVLLAVSLLTVATSGSLVFLQGRASGPLAATAGQPAAKADDKPRSAPLQGEREKTVEIQGRVLDPDGKPFAGARLLLRSDATVKEADLPVRATTDKAGLFRFTAKSTDFDPQGKATLAATAKGFGPDWIELTAESKDDITLRLVKDDVPIEGRVLNLEGQPVEGVRVHVVRLHRGDLNAWMKVILAYNGPLPEGKRSEILGASASAITGKDGRFRLTGIGRERGVELRIQGPGIEWARLWAVTRPGPARGWRSGQEGLYGATFDWLAGPCKSIIGTVRDKATGKPVMGLHVSSGNPPVGTATVLTDRQGRYRIDGVGKRNNYSVGVWGVPYLDCWRDEVPDTPALEPLVVDFQVQRGIVITGHLIDKTTRKPVQGWVLYVALPDNPNRKCFTLIHGQFTSFNDVVGQTKPDGSFQVIALPGPGLLRVRPDDTDRYHQAEVRIDPKADAKIVKQDIVLERAPALPVQIQDGDSKPLRGVWAVGSSSQNQGAIQCEEATCSAYQLEAGKPRLMVFFHSQRHLVGTLTLKGDEKKPVTVKLGPVGSIKGRLLDTSGKPLAGVVVELQYRHPAARAVHSVVFRAKQIVTDAKGGFVLEDLIPQQPFELSFRRGRHKFERTPKPAHPAIEVKPGECRDCRDVGAIKLKQIPEMAGE